MTKRTTKATETTVACNPRASRSKAKTTSAATTAKVKPPTRTAFLIELMRAENGETAQTLAEAVGWQVHSVRGFISGTVKKRADLKVITTKVDDVTRYAVRDVAAAGE